MRAASLLFLALALSAHAQGDALSRIGGTIGESRPPAPTLREERTFAVGSVRTDAQRAQLLDLFDLASATHTADAQGRVTPKPSATAVRKSGDIDQRISTTQFLMRDDWLLVTAEPQTWVDGDHVSRRPLVEDGIYTFTTVLGASRSVRRFRDAASAPSLTREQFLAALKAGQRIVVEPAPEQTRCLVCFGKGQVRQDGSKGGDESKTQPCAACAGQGKRTIQPVTTLIW